MGIGRVPAYITFYLSCFYIGVLCPQAELHIPFLEILFEDEITGVSVYPNPTNGVFNVKLPSDSKVEIYNTLGELVWKFENANATTHTLNMSGYASGVYSLKISVAEKLSMIKLVKE